LNSKRAVRDFSPASPYYEDENPSLTGKDFSTDRKRVVILRVFVSSWWIGLSLYHEDAKTQRIASFGCGFAAPG